MWETSAMRATLAFSLGAEPCQQSPWWNEPPPALTTTGTVSISVPSGAAARTGASQSSGAGNGERSGGDTGRWCEPGPAATGPEAEGVSWRAGQHEAVSG